MPQRLAQIKHLPSLAKAYFKGYTGRSSTQLALSKFKFYQDAMLQAYPYLSNTELEQHLAIPDLTDPQDGSHAMQLLLTELNTAMLKFWDVASETVRPYRIVEKAENYNRLNFDASAVARDRRYSLHVNSELMLRTHMSSAGPGVIKSIDPSTPVHDKLYIMPGIAYRRDTIDRFHVGALHQVDYWRIRKGKHFTASDITQFAATIVNGILPGAKWRLVPASHPYTHHAKQIDIWFDNQWLEIAEAGIVTDQTLHSNGLTTGWSGILLGIGLDRAVMVRKNIPDIRYLRSEQPAIANQMQDLEPWQPLPAQQITRKHLSLVMDAQEDNDTLGDKVRAILGASINHVETIRLTSKKAYPDLAPTTRAELKIQEGQAKIEIEITLRALDQVLTEREIEDICATIRTHLHQRQEKPLDSEHIRMIS